MLKNAFGILIFLSLTPWCGTSASYRWPTKEWSTALPSQVGIQQAEFEKFLSYVFPDGQNWEDRTGVRTEALVIIKDGYLVFERYQRGYRPEQRHLAWSMTKLALNALVGAAVHKQTIKLSDPVPLRPEIQVRHLLAWSSGLDWRETYEYNPLRSSVLSMLYDQGRPDIPAFVAPNRMAYAPGAHFNYSSGDSNLLMYVLRKALGEAQYADFPWKALFDKLGMSSATLEQDASGNFVASSYLHLTPRDMAKLGLLYLNDGVWGRERILPEGWIYESSKIVPAFRQTAFELKHEHLNPGYHIWVNRSDESRGIKRPLPDAPETVMAALGHWGQSMWILPSERVVVVRMADDRDRGFSANRFLRLLLEALPWRAANP